MQEYIRNNKVLLSVITILLLIITFCIYYFIIDVEKTIEPVAIEKAPEIEKEPMIEEPIQEIKEPIVYYNIDIKGSVQKPGVYKITEGSIVMDAINKAGGFLDNAYLDNINLSKLIKNEMVIYIYSEDQIKTEEIENITNSEEIIIDTSEKETIFIDENIPSEDKAEAIINLNTASLEDLMTLSGIGESKAKAIIEYRNNKMFETKEELKEVSGIGDSTYESLKDNITV